MTNLKSARLYGYLRFNIIKLEATNMNLMVGIIKGYQLYLEIRGRYDEIIIEKFIVRFIISCG